MQFRVLLGGLGLCRATLDVCLSLLGLFLAAFQGGCRHSIVSPISASVALITFFGVRRGRYL